MEFQPTMVAHVPVIVGLAIVIGVAAGSRPVRAQDLSRADTSRARVYGGERFRVDELMPLRRGQARISLFHRQPDDPAQPDALRGGDRPFRLRTTSAIAKRTGEREGSGLVDALTDLLIPVLGITRDQLHDSFGNARIGHRHQGMDILAPKGTPVVAAVDGAVLKMKWDRGGGRTLRLLDQSGKYVLYYAHLSRYATGLQEGSPVRKGQVVAYVGKTGTVHGSAHLHLAITSLLGDTDHWWQARPLNPYTLLRRALGLPCDSTQAGACGTEAADTGR